MNMMMCTAKMNLLELLQVIQLMLSTEGGLFLLSLLGCINLKKRQNIGLGMIAIGSQKAQDKI
ncbi:hypothetical protein MASRES_GEN12915_18405 [Acinetobacter baumannii]